ncbi:MAG: hypothetical protein RLP02_16240, partial [Coleofasciculus sp. C2-GNP5-27]
MSSFSSKFQRFRPRRPFATDWLVDVLPRFFDRSLERIGLSHFKWLVLFLLVISIPLIITPLKVWQQGIVAF